MKFTWARIIIIFYVQLKLRDAWRACFVGKNKGRENDHGVGNGETGERKRSNHDLHTSRYRTQRRNKRTTVTLSWRKAIQRLTSLCYNLIVRDFIKKKKKGNVWVGDILSPFLLWKIDGDTMLLLNSRFLRFDKLVLCTKRYNFRLYICRLIEDR